MAKWTRHILFVFAFLIASPLSASDRLRAQQHFDPIPMGYAEYVVGVGEDHFVFTQTTVSKITYSDDHFTRSAKTIFDCLGSGGVCQAKGIRAPSIAEDGSSIGVFLHPNQYLTFSTDTLEITGTHRFPEMLSVFGGEPPNSNWDMNDIHAALSHTDKDLLYYGASFNAKEDRVVKGIFKWTFRSGEIKAINTDPEIFDQCNVVTPHLFSREGVFLFACDSIFHTAIAFDAFTGKELERYDIAGIREAIKTEVCRGDCRFNLRDFELTTYPKLFGRGLNFMMPYQFIRQNQHGFGVATVSGGKITMTVPAFSYPGLVEGEGHRGNSQMLGSRLLYENEFRGVIGNSNAFCVLQSAGPAAVFANVDGNENWRKAGELGDGGVSINRLNDGGLLRSDPARIDRQTPSAPRQSNRSFSTDGPIICAEVTRDGIHYVTLQ